MGRLTGFAPCRPHEFCMGGRGKLQNSKGQVLLDFLGEPSPFLPLRSATMAIAWPCPRLKSAFSQATTAPAFTPALSLPPAVKPLSVASRRKSAGLLPVFAWMLSR